MTADKQNPEKEVMETRPRGTFSGDSLDALREQEEANYRIADKEFGQQNDNNSLT